MSTVLVTKDRLRKAVFDYIVQSRVGDSTLSYTTTAAMSADDAADSSAERLWTLLDEVAQQFVVGEDLVAGQIATLDGGGRLVAFASADECQQGDFFEV